MQKGYRINGFDQIKAFYSWVFNNAHENVTAQHISLYVFFINQNNRVNWIEWFKCPYDIAMAGACIGNKRTYYRCLNDLVSWGLIQYQKGANEWKAPLIKIEVLKCTSTDTATVPLPTTLPTTLLLPLPTTLPTHIYKLLTNNLKRITDNIEAVIEFLNNGFKEEEKKVDEMSDILKEQIKSLCEFFGFNELNFFAQYAKAVAFLTIIEQSGRIDHYSRQFENYKKYKKLAAEKVQGFDKFIGDPEKQYADGFWNAENWGEKIIKLQANMSKSDLREAIRGCGSNDIEREDF